MRVPLAIALALPLSAGCITTETRAVSSTPTPAVRVGTHARTWEVRCAGELVGQVVLFQEHGLARDSVYVVRNPWHQDLGLIDGLGRAYRYLPHHEEPAWVGSGTVTAGAERILGLSGACELVEIADPDPAVEASSGSAADDGRDGAEPRTPDEGSAPASRPTRDPLPDGGLAPAR
jgi:hypothetical protein